MSKIVLTAHAGVEGTEDNTWKSIKLAKSLPCDVVELDVRKADGRMMLSHNEVDDVEEPVLLKDAFILLRGSGKKINCDLKEEGIFGEILEIGKQTGVLEQLLYTGSVTEADIQEFSSEVDKIFFNVENLFSKEEIEGLRDGSGGLDSAGLEEIFSKYQTLGLTGMNIYYKLVDEKLLEAAQRYGVRVAVWTVDEEEDMKAVMKLPIFGVTTRNIKQWRKLEEK